MAKKLLSHLYHGFTATVSVCLFVELFIAQVVGHTVTAEFAAYFRNEGAAVLVQLGLVGLIGMTFAGAALIFEIEKWSYLKQGLVHFIITAAVWMPIAWLCWKPFSDLGLWLSIGGWTFTYIVNWGVQYIIARRRIEALNRSIRVRREEEETN